MKAYLAATTFLDFDHPNVIAYASRVTGVTPKEKAISIYYLVRDSIRYNAYTVKDGIPSLKASYAATTGQAYCIPKAALMTALCRYFGIPAKIGFADVKNHLSDKKMLEWLRTDYFAMHGYSEIYLNEQWIKCTPIFNKALCEKFNVEPLEFDGENDAIFQNFTKDGAKYMEYLKNHGSFADMPVEYIFQTFHQYYPHFSKYLDKMKRQLT